MSKNDYSDEKFWQKIRRYVGRLSRPALTELLSLYYCLQDRDTPLLFKSQIVVTLGYFILPTDIIPDVFLGVGYTDDIAMIASTYANLTPYIKTEHKDSADKAVNDLFDLED